MSTTVSPEPSAGVHPRALRYVYIAALIASMLVPVVVVEWLFRVTGSGLSLWDTRGVGQVSLIVIVLMMVGLFSHFVAKDPPDFFVKYLRNWRRALAGFALFYLATSCIIVLAYLVFAARGAVSWSEAGIAALSWKIAERTVVGLLVVVVLATTEEILFRVFLTRYLRWNTGAPVTIAAVAVASALFAVSHAVADPRALEPALFTGLFLFGVLMATTYLATGSFLCAVGVHTGLLGSKVFLRKTQILEIDPSAMMLSDSVDLRMSPIVWAIFAGLALAIYLMRRPLNARFAIEKPVLAS